MLPAKLDLTVYQGDDWERVLVFRDAAGVPENLTNMTGLSQIRPTAESDVLTATITVTVLDQIAAPGTVRLSMPAAVTAGIAPGKYVYDMQLTPPTRTRIAGKVTVVRQVTR